MADRPILFSAPMVRALLEGRKTQTRRVFKMPEDGFDAMFHDDDGSWHIGDAHTGRYEHNLPIHYRVGDRLWVRETHYVWSAGNKDGTGRRIAYRATEPDAPTTWTVSIHMPRWASRLTLTVTGVRVQRLQEISEGDCLAEGAFIQPPRPYDHGQVFVHRDPKETWHSMTPRAWYHELWDAINGDGAWDANPWVVALTFTVERRNIDAPEAMTTARARRG